MSTPWCFPRWRHDDSAAPAAGEPVTAVSVGVRAVGAVCEVRAVSAVCAVRDPDPDLDTVSPDLGPASAVRAVLAVMGVLAVSM